MAENAEDSLCKLLGDLDRAAGCDSYDGKNVADAYFGGYAPETCNRSYVTDVMQDVSRRLHALMPHGKDGHEIKAGDVMRLSGGVDHLVKGFTVCPTERGEVIACHSEAWTIVPPDSWERLEDDAMLTACEYMDKVSPCPEGRYAYVAISEMTRDIVRRAKKLAGVE